jgi:hypothetical protein
VFEEGSPIAETLWVRLEPHVRILAPLVPEHPVTWPEL